MDQLSFILYNTNQLQVDQKLIQQLTEKGQGLAASNYTQSTQPTAAPDPPAADKQRIICLLIQRISKLEQKQSERKQYYEKIIQSLSSNLLKTNSDLNTQKQQIISLNEELNEAKGFLETLRTLVQPTHTPTTVIEDQRVSCQLITSVQKL